MTEILREQKLLEHLGGVAAGSGGSLPGAFVAAGGNFSHFAEHFPKKGWGGLGPSEPKITVDYERLLDATLPSTFQELKHPLGLSLTHWDDLQSLKKFDHQKQQGFAIASGNLHQALIAAVTTSGDHPSCPKCAQGFWPRRVQNRFPVTDGAFGDIWGVKGLSAIPYCEKVLHLLPVDYPGQVEPPSLTDLPKNPREMVSLAVVQPPIASHSYLHEDKPLFKLFTQRTSEQWNTKMFETTYHAMLSALDQTLNFTPDASGNKQAIVSLDHSELTAHETLPEQVYDRILALERDRFWAFYGTDGKDAWHDLPKILHINQKLQEKHTQRLLNDIGSGTFPHLGASSMGEDGPTR